MEQLEALKTRLLRELPGTRIALVSNAAVPSQGSLAVPPSDARAVARWLRDTPDLRLDFCSNVTGVDWPDRDEKVMVRRTVDGIEKEVTEVQHRPGYLEVVYHLYSVALGGGPVILRQRTSNRTTDVEVASLTPVWRSCEFQEREVYDLFGVRFSDHPDLRRILLWEGFRDHPMRRDYVPPDDYEYEPTPHDEVLERAQRHRASQEAPR
ncbi:MAG: NADH-quinone oxidoreductase subunit C [Verrucomicrobiales bacterium]|nr:NADH-quinone oxidoreductase subunit C [Verrucomicrobiales bacterium]